MWPFSGLSIGVANFGFDVANAAPLLSLIVGVISTFAIVRLGSVKELHWESQRDSAAKEVAGLRLETAKANSSAASANAEADKARLETEAIREGWRGVDSAKSSTTF